MSKMKTAQ